MNWVLALASSALLILVFPKWDLAWLAPFAVIPLALASAREQNFWRRFAFGWASGIAYWFGLCNWIHFTLKTHGGMSSTAAWLVFLLFCAAKGLQTGLFAGVAGWTMRIWFAAPATAALWVVIEYTHAPLGFAWLMLGNAAIGMTLPLRLAPVTGVWGMSFLFALISAALACVLLKGSWRQILWLCAVPLVWLLPPLPTGQPGSDHAILVQPNIPETEEFTPAAFLQLLRRMRQLSLDPASSREAQSLIVWPESPAPFYDNDREFMTYLAELARTAHKNVLAGLIGSAPGGASRNSASLLAADGSLVSRYDKVNLVPFGEFIPWPLGPVAFKITKEVSDFQPGERIVVSPMNGQKIAAFICYESVFPGFIRSFVRAGATAMFNPSNDGWFGKTAARNQHLEIVRMRAAENARWIVRATNDGISAAIDPSGAVRQSLPLYEEASASVGFSYRSELTFYTQHGDWFPLLCSAITCVAVVEFFRTRRRGART